jgi:hypothetical protein
LIILMVACMHIALALRLKSKIWEHLYWYLQVYEMIFVPLSIMSWKKKSLKTSKISSFSFRLYFLIVGVSSIMYYLL